MNLLNSIMKTATVADIKIGSIVFEGLMFADGTFGIAVPQAARLFSFSINHASRDFKALINKDNPFSKAKTTLNSKEVSVMTLEEFQLLIRKLDRLGNEVAMAIVDALLGLSLHQLYCDAFKIRFEQEERQEWLNKRDDGINERNNLTDMVKMHINNNPGLSVNKKQWLYKHLTDAVYKHMFGRTAQALRKDWGFCGNIREALSPKELRDLQYYEMTICRLVCDGQCTDPEVAVSRAFSLMPYSVNTRMTPYLINGELPRKAAK